MNFNLTIGSSDVDELVKDDKLILPQATNTATVLSGTGAFIAPIAIWELVATKVAAVSPEVAEYIRQIGEALEEQEDVASISPDATGISFKNNLLLRRLPTGHRHGARIKIAIDPPTATREVGTVTVSVPFDSDKIARDAHVSAKLIAEVRQFIELNRELLVSYIYGDVTDDALFRQLRPISSNK